jgi:putative ABC transport system permease protein
LGEFAILTLLALPLGCLLGYGMAWLFTLAFDTDIFRLPLVVERSTYGFAVLVVALAAMVSGLVVRRRIDRLNLIEVLKTRE